MIEFKITEEVIEVQEDTNIDEEKITYKEIKDPYGFIYITTNLVNGKRYLGQRAFTEGWNAYLGSGNNFKKALKKYGKENFHRDIIYICYSKEDLNQIEYELSIFFNVVESNDWYNLVLGGGTSRGWRPTEETRKKISEAAKERLADPTNHPNYGKHGLSGEKNPQFGVSPKKRMDDETYKQWYEKHKKYWQNPPTKGKHIWTDKLNPNLGKKMSNEQKEKLSNIRKSKHIGSKPVYCIELNEIFWGAKDANEQLNINKINITQCCMGDIKSAGKHPVTGELLHWKYVNDNTKKNGIKIQGAISLGYITKQQFNEYLDNLTKKGNDN